MAKTLVIGFGISGKAATTFLLKKGKKVVAIDQNLKKMDVSTFLEQGVEIYPDETSLKWEEIEQVIVSPGISHEHPIVKKSKALKLSLHGEIELAFQHIDQKVIAITGTNGKTTVTLLIEHFLKFHGIPAKAVGNIGKPLTQELLELKDEVLVVELSSFQLETLKTCKIDCALLLNITPDHLDRYSSMEEYAKAKIHIAKCLKEDGRFIVEERTYRDFQTLFEEKPLLYGYGKDLDYSTDGISIFKKGIVQFEVPEILKSSKSHDLENFMAAFAAVDACSLGNKSLLEAFHQFQKPHHRIEFIKEIDGVRFFDDSKGTNIDAVLRAVETMTGKVHLIAGGVDKGFPYTSWAIPFRDKVKEIYAIGESKNKIHQDLSPNLPVHLCENLQDAVEQAFKNAQKGEVILLSPGCSSFDMFKDYVHRGEVFQKIVKKLSTSLRSVV